MKKKMKSLAALAIIVIAASALCASAAQTGSSKGPAPTSAPPTALGFTSAGGGINGIGEAPKSDGPHKLGATASGKPIWVRQTSVIMPSPTSASWSGALNQLISDAKAGALGTNTTLADPVHYGVSNGRIEWQNLAFSTSGYEWNGLLNPASPFDKEMGGPLHCVLIHGIASSGLDEVSLDMIVATNSSPSDGNVLHDTIVFVGTYYTPTAPLKKADGSFVTSGAASEKGVEVWVLVCFRSFNGAGTQSGLDSDKTWMAYYYPYVVLTLAQIAGDDTTRSYVSVTTDTNAVPVPNLATAMKGDGTVNVWVPNPNSTTETSYVLLGASVAEGPYNEIVGIVNGNGVANIPAAGTTHYFRAEVQE